MRLITHKAFTLIEVLISVLILSGAVVFVLKLHTQTQQEINYIVQRHKLALQDSLFVSSKVLNYHKENKTAYDIITQKIRVHKLKSREILQQIKRDIFIPEAIDIKHNTIKNIPDAQIEEIKMKDKYSSYYFHFKITSL